MLSEATSEPEDDLTKIIVSSLSHALTDQNDTASSLEHGSDIFSEAPGSSIEALALDPPLSEDDYVFHMADEEGLDDLFLDHLMG